MQLTEREESIYQVGIKHGRRRALLDFKLIKARSDMLETLIADFKSSGMAGAMEPVTPEDLIQRFEYLRKRSDMLVKVVKACAVAMYYWCRHNMGTSSEPIGDGRFEDVESLLNEVQALLTDEEKAIK